VTLSATSSRRWRPGDPIEPVARLLERGGLLAIPTESSYGLAVLPGSARGVEAVARVKGRPQEMGLPVVAASREQIVALGVAPDSPQLDLLAPLWPAPLTVVLDLGSPLPAGRSDDGGTVATVAVRIPACPPLLDLLESLGRALTATSANRTGEPPVLDPADLCALLDGEDWLWVDGGVLAGGPPSTLVRWDAAGDDRKGRWNVLRAGAFVDLTQ
jgi:L-threonylcarbamoyladenylate synthase